jgi:hypothetical protein
MRMVKKHGSSYLIEVGLLGEKQMLLQVKVIIPPNKLSLLALSANLNTTTNNQGNHCIIAHNEIETKPAVQSGDQVLDINDQSEENCRGFSSSDQALTFCQYVFNTFAWLYRI